MALTWSASSSSPTAWLASDRAVRLEDDSPRAHLGGARYSTPEMLALEQRLITDAAERRRAGVARVDPVAATATLDTRPGVSGEQAAMASRLTTSGQGVEVVRAAAGTGKTHALAAARELWEAHDVRVVGTALPARAALELENLAGIDSATIASVLRDIDQGHGLARCLRQPRAHRRRPHRPRAACHARRRLVKGRANGPASRTR